MSRGVARGWSDVVCHTPPETHATGAEAEEQLCRNHLGGGARSDGYSVAFGAMSGDTGESVEQHEQCAATVDAGTVAADAGDADDDVNYHVTDDKNDYDDREEDGYDDDDDGVNDCEDDDISVDDGVGDGADDGAFLANCRPPPLAMQFMLC